MAFVIWPTLPVQPYVSLLPKLQNDLLFLEESGIFILLGLHIYHFHILQRSSLEQSLPHLLSTVKLLPILESPFNNYILLQILLWSLCFQVFLRYYITYRISIVVEASAAYESLDSKYYTFLFVPYFYLSLWLAHSKH